MKRSDVFKSVTDRIILGLENGIVHWRNPLKNDVITSLPMNLVSTNHYSGINVLLLSMDDYKSPYWLTFNQIKRSGGTISAGETSTEIVFWDFMLRIDKLKKMIELKVYNALPEKEKANSDMTSFGHFYNVFNADQIDGVKHPNWSKQRPLNARIKACDKSVVYIKNWLNVLKDDKCFVFKASNEAQKAVRYILK